MNISTIRLWIYSSLLALFPLVLIALPANFFDQGQSYCLSVMLLNKTCPGCGITRAIQHAIHFNFETAWHYNRLFVIVLPLLIGVWYSTLQSNIRRLKKHYNQHQTRV